LSGTLQTKKAEENAAEVKIYNILGSSVSYIEMAAVMDGE
jgi:hypothetical protein